MRIIFDEDVEEYFSGLVELLYNEKHFGFKESAYNYVDDIIDEIVSNIAKYPPKMAPEYFAKFGLDLNYIVYPKSKNTQWYVFFNYENGIYYIRYISNNHNCAQYL